MMLSRQSLVLEAAPESVNPLEWLRSALAALWAKFGSWQPVEEDDEPLDCADPQLVAALEFIASLLPEDGPSER